VVSDPSKVGSANRSQHRVADAVRQAAAAAVFLVFVVFLVSLGTGQSWAAGDVPLGTAMASVRSSFGIPDAIRFDSAGRQIWEYTGRRAPSGAYRLSFDAQGAVREATPLRSPERLAQVRAGETTTAELVELLGEPTRITATDGGLAWLFSRAGEKAFTVTLGADRRVKSVSGPD
jgi:hypothetical protein